MEYLGSVADEDGTRDLYVESLDSFTSWPALRDGPLWRAAIEDESAGFALFLACDAAALTVEEISSFAVYCVDHDVFWVAAYGSGCERVHDIFDEVDTARGMEDRGVVMTTWHHDEELADALGLFWHAFPDGIKRGGAARIVLVVGSDDWLAKARRAVADELAG